MLGTISDTLSPAARSTSPASASSTSPSAATRQGVNPQTRERITIPGGKVPRFTAGSALKKAVKGG